MAKKSWIKPLIVKKDERMKLQQSLIKSFKPWLKISKMVYLQQHLKIKRKQPSSCKLFVLMDLTALSRSSVISAKAMSIIQSSRKTLISLEREQLNTLQMLLPTMLELRQNKNRRSNLCRFLTLKFNHNADFLPPSQYRGQK